MEGVLAFIGCMTTIEYEEIVQRMRPRLVKLGARSSKTTNRQPMPFRRHCSVSGYYAKG